MRLHPIFVWGLCAFLGFFNEAAAESTLSQSNEPASILNARLKSLLGQEHKALSMIGRERLRELTTPPAPPVARAGKKKTVTYDNAWLQSQPPARGDAQFQCLAQALYFEARGESLEGQFAVGEVILNRVKSQRFPNSVCAVIHQGTGRKYQCQFTFTCDGRKEVITEQTAYARVAKVARALLDGAERNLTRGATYYHSRAVRPRWSRKFMRTAKIGQHYFYVPPVRLSKR